MSILKQSYSDDDFKQSTLPEFLSIAEWKVEDSRKINHLSEVSGAYDAKQTPTVVKLEEKVDKDNNRNLDRMHSNASYTSHT